MSDEQFRKAFEAWMLKRSAHAGLARYATKPADYKVSGVQLAWESWQESRRVALEEAAKLCEDISDEYAAREGQRYPELKTDAQCGARDCETAIRALASKTQEGS